jgi:outer membrane receptor protein involved in Fe transport
LTQNRFAGGENTQYGFFVEDDWTLGPITLTGGLRADHYTISNGYYRALSPAGAVIRNDVYASQSDWEVSWRGGVLLRANDAVALRAAAYSGFRLPTLNELYRPFVVFPITTNANAALTPERLEGWEAGIDLTPMPGLRFQATYFDNRVKDAIANVTTGTNVRQRQNVDAVAARGLEMAANLVQGDFSFDGSVSLTDAEVRGSGAAAALSGKRPSQVPEFAASATVSWRPAEGAILAATLRHVGDQFEDDLETDVLPSATTVDLFGQIPLVSRLSAVARVENLFDEEIVTRNAGGSIDLGTPMTVWLGLRWGFCRAAPRLHHTAQGPRLRGPWLRREGLLPGQRLLFWFEPPSPCWRRCSSIWPGWRCLPSC